MVNILGVLINNITMAEAVKKTEDFFDGKPHMVFTPNPEIIMDCEKNEELKEIINSADLRLPDGIGVVIAASVLGKSIKERVSGFDYVCELLKTDRSFYFLGGKPGVAQRAMDKLVKKGVRVVGCHDGYFKDDKPVIYDICEKTPDVLVVCLGAPAQEKWVYSNLHKLNVPVSIGAGGTLDVLAGDVKRAPEIYQRLCIEWLYRAIKEPKKRLPRIVKLPKFVINVIMRGKNYN